MTAEKVREVLELYRSRLEDEGSKPSRAPMDRFIDPNNVDIIAGQHILYMIERMETFLEEGRIEKSFRWLGFIQGCLWCAGYYTVDELRQHNMPGDQPS